MWMRSECAGPWLHRWRIGRQWRDCVEETCDICHEQIFTKVRDGRINNYEYISTHLRSSLQPSHPRFAKEYPSSTYASLQQQRFHR